MKVWKVTEGDPTLFNGAPEWATQIAASGDCITYEERLGKVGAKWQRTDAEYVHIYGETNSINGWEVIARRKLVDENQKPKRKKGPKLTPKTVSRVFIRYADGTSYNIKKAQRLVVMEDETQVVISESESSDGAVAKQDAVFLLNGQIDTITIIAEHFVSLLKYNTSEDEKILLIENGNIKLISRAEFNIQGNE